MATGNILERKPVIQLFGSALILAPFFNTVVMIATHPEIPNRWSWSTFFQLLTAGPTSNHVLYFFSIAIGLVMLRGSVSSWKYVLVLLGANIAMQVSHFDKIRSSQVTALFFTINTGLFLLVTYFFVWKQPTAQQLAPKSTEPLEPAVPAAQAPTPAPQVLEAKKKIIFQFEGLSPWAELINVSKKGFHLRAIAEPPPEVTSKEIEFALKTGLVLRGRLARQMDSDYFFEHQPLQSNDVRLLNEWLKTCA